MMTNLIVIISIALAIAYLLVWVFKRDIRDQIEKPKYHFIDNVKKYDRNLVQDQDK